MPTVVVLDVSASLLRPADLVDRETTRQDVAQRGAYCFSEKIELRLNVFFCVRLTTVCCPGVLHFLQWLERWQKFEPICLVTMSSTCRILVPFETDHKTLRTALYDIALEDTASVTSGLSAACSLLQEQFGTDAAGCQVVLVVDGAPSFTEAEQLETIIPLLPRAVVFHILAMGTESEIAHCDIYKTLTSRSKGSFTHVRIPQVLQALSFIASIRPSISPACAFLLILFSSRTRVHTRARSRGWRRASTSRGRASWCADTSKRPSCSTQTRTSASRWASGLGQMGGPAGQWPRTRGAAAG